MSVKAMVEFDLRQTELGLGPSDPNLATPFGSRLPAARIFLRNHSARQKRKYVKIPVSFKRGAAAALQADAELRKIYNIATYREAVGDGRTSTGVDMNVYDFKTQPVGFVMKFDGRQWPIPPAQGDAEPPLVAVPEGCWDILCGNYERMNSKDERVRSEEQARFANSQSFKHSPILFVNVDGKMTTKDNPFGFLEIVRITEKMEPVSPDTEFLTALELVES